MKVIASISGIAGINIANEQTVPKIGFLQRDFVSYLTERYSFASGPVLANSTGLVNLTILQFQAGLCTTSNAAIPIIQLLGLPDGDLVTAQDTDLADAVHTDYMNSLEKNMNFRFSEWNLKRIYQSFLLVDFKQSFIDRLEFASIKHIVNKTAGKEPTDGYFLKRFALGESASNHVPPTPTVHQFMSKDFVIERRVNEPMGSNRFFCSAPLATATHIRCLEEIEADGS